MFQAVHPLQLKLHETDKSNSHNKQKHIIKGQVKQIHKQISSPRSSESKDLKA